MFCWVTRHLPCANLRCNLILECAVLLSLKHFQAEILSEFSLSARPNITPSSPLIPVEPRFAITIGIRQRILDEPGSPPKLVEPTPARASVGHEPQVSPPVQPTAAAAVTERIAVTIVDPQGQPLSDATVELRTGAGLRALDFQSGSTYVSDAAPVGHGRLSVRA